MLAIVAASIAAALDLAFAALGWDVARAVTKPLPALILAGYALLAPGRAARLLGIGLVLAAAGDECLLRPGDAPLIAGMLAFAAMHACYIAAFWSMGDGAAAGRPITQAIGTLYVIALIAVNWLLHPGAGAFGLPLLLYGIVLTAMAISALDLIGRIPLRYALPIAAGAAVFVASDTTLAFSRFWAAWQLSPPTSEVLIVGTYFAAQLAIAWGVAGFANRRATAS
jgi:uncharacterized membrane protein YhhN